MRDRETEPEMLLDGAEDQHVGEILALQLCADIGGKVGGDLRLLLLAHRENAAKAIAGFVLAHAEMVLQRRRRLPCGTI